VISLVRTIRPLESHYPLKGGPEIPATLMRASYARAAARPGMREAIKPHAFPGIDWDRVTEIDKKLSQVLKVFLVPDHKRS
jgi:hypothetical protein